jgi:hypothetical protein
MKIILTLKMIVIFILGLYALELEADANTVALWHFNEGSGDTVYDVSGNGNHGVINGASWVNGINGKALSFNGSSDYITTNLKIHPDSFPTLTMEAWVMPTADPVKLDGVMNGDDGGYDRGVGIHIDNKWTIQVGNTNWKPGPIGDINSWQHIVVIYSPANIKFCKNGVCYNYNSAGSFGTSNQPLVIGQDIACGGCYFSGIIDEVSVYDSALSNSEILSHYQMLLTKQPVLFSIKSPTYERRPEFKWYAVDSVSSYTIQIDTAIDFSDPITTISIDDTTFTPLSDLPTGIIYWHVTVEQLSLYSEISSFVIQDSSIPIPIPYEPNPTKERQPKLTWHSVEGASAYHIMIDDNSDFSSAEVSLAVVDTFFTPLSDLPFGMIYWKVKSDLYDEYSQASTFYIQPDTIPFLYTFNGAATSEKQPEFMWIPVSSASTYKIQIDTSLSFSSPVVSIEVGDTSFAPLSDLKHDMYYWRVSCDLDFNAFSQIDSIEIDTNLVATEKGRDLNSTEFAIYPTPFNPTTTIYFQKNNGYTNITIYAINGKTVARFNNIKENQIKWNASTQPSGIYIININSGEKVYSKRICLIK